MRKKPPPPPAPLDRLEEEPYRQAWLALTPGERLRRSWRMRRFLQNPQAIHDAKTFPEP